MKTTICQCANRKLIDIQAIEECVKSHSDVEYVEDLCYTAIHSPEQMRSISQGKIAACFPRAIRSLFDNHKLNPVEIIPLRDYGAAQSTPNTGNDAWYPTIDKERCTECGKCHDFCLFGVYSVVDGIIKVTSPTNCKNNCPACARVCPSKAIIFPKYDKSPINGGDKDEEQAIKVDTKALYADALKMKLDERKAKITLLKR